jgi:ribonuclease VapC
MAIFIRDPATDAAVRRFAEFTKQPLTDAIRDAVTAEYHRRRNQTPLQDRLAELNQRYLDFPPRDQATPQLITPPARNDRSRASETQVRPKATDGSLFLDASAIIALIASDHPDPQLAGRLAQAHKIHVSPIVLFEVVAALAGKRACPAAAAEEIAQAILAECKANMIHITASIASAAIAAQDIYGEGRHPAGLTLQQCFSYACAHAYRLPILSDGDHFAHTDIAIA